MDLLTLYLIEVIPQISIPLKVMGGIGLGISVFVFIIYMVFLDNPPLREDLKIEKYLSKILKYLFVCSISGIIIGNLIPSSSGIYRIIGAYYVTNIEGINELPKSTVKAMNKFLEDYAIAE